MLANWLFYNGVTYGYERHYEHDTADATHGRYRPDFYYPDIDAYHEHWALNSAGQPPPQFAGYLDGVRWKRDTHAQLVRLCWRRLRRWCGTVPRSTTWRRS